MNLTISEQANVLIYLHHNGGQPEALLNDFGVSDVVSNDVDDLHTANQVTNVRWLAPELCGTPGDRFVRVTKEGDIYALGCVYLEVRLSCRICVSSIT